MYMCIRFSSGMFVGLFAVESAIYMPPGDKTLIRCLNQDRPFGKGFQCNESAGCNVRLQSNSMDRPVGKGFHRNGCSEWIQSGEVSEQVGG